MKRRSLQLLLACCAVVGCAAVFAAPAKASRTRVQGRVIVTLRDGILPAVSKSATGVQVDRPALQALADRFHVSDMSRLFQGMGAPRKAGEPDLRLVWAVDFPPEHDLDAVVAAYAASPDVVRAEAVDICPVLAIPDDPNLSAQWYLRNTTIGGKDIRAVGGWAEAVGDTDVIIAIVDSGVDWQHPDLGGAGPNYRRGAIWTNWVEVNGTGGVDDDGNGMVDDYRGWDFVTGVQGVPGEDVRTADNDPSDFGGHGTGCSGVAAAITNNGVGIAGASWGCKIMPVRAGWVDEEGSPGVVRMDFAAQGMVYAASNGAKLVNCSWGSSEVSYLISAVDFCTSQGAIVVAAAGNDNIEDDVLPDGPFVGYLSYDPDVLAAAATNELDGKASFSNFGAWVEVSAPGVNIYTSWYVGATGTHTYATVSGTSFSSPLTCGALALIWSANPGWSRGQVIERLLSSADDLDALNPVYAGKLGAGRVNLLRALGDSFQEVPDEFPVLFDALNEAAPGDTVAVTAAAPLPSSVVIPNKALFVLGGWDSGYTSRDPVGQPSAIVASPGAPGLLIQGGAGPSTVVDGFSVNGGGGQILSTPQYGRYGGGLLCNGASPTLRNLELTGGAVGGATEFGGGGGAMLLNSLARLEDCRIHGNTATQGAGLYVYGGAPTLDGCLVYGNTLRQNTSGFPPRGGGVYAADTDLTLTGCEIHGHVDSESGGGIYAANNLATTSLDMADNAVHDNTARLKGGGLLANGATIAMKRDLFQDNGQAAGASFMNGGGFALENATATLDSVVARGNDADMGGGGAVSGGSSVSVRNSVFAQNTADIFAGGLSYQSAVGGEIAGCTLTANNGYLGAGGLYLALASPTVTNNIVASNTGGSSFANGVQVSSGTPTFACNDAWDNAVANYGGIADPTGLSGNISLDPKFCAAAAGDWAIDAGSPCSPANSGGCGLIGALAVACSATPVEDGPPAPVLVFRVEPASPNPFNPITSIRFSLPAAARTLVRVYDVAGRVVRTLVDAELQAAAHVAIWDGRDDGGRLCPSGVYFYRVASGEHAATGRVAMVK